MRKRCFVFFFFGSFQWLLVGSVGFYCFLNCFGQFLVVFIGFTYGFALFWVSPLVFHFLCFRIGFDRKTKGTLLEN